MGRKNKFNDQQKNKFAQDYIKKLLSGDVYSLNDYYKYADKEFEENTYPSYSTLYRFLKDNEEYNKFTTESEKYYNKSDVEIPDINLNNNDEEIEEKKEEEKNNQKEGEKEKKEGDEEVQLEEDIKNVPRNKSKNPDSKKKKQNNSNPVVEKNYNNLSIIPIILGFSAIGVTGYMIYKKLKGGNNEKRTKKDRRNGEKPAEGKRKREQEQEYDFDI